MSAPSVLVVGSRRLYLQALCEYLSVKAGVEASYRAVRDASSCAGAAGPKFVLIDCSSGADEAASDVAIVSESCADARLLLLVPSPQDRAVERCSPRVIGSVAASLGPAELLRWLGVPSPRASARPARARRPASPTELSSLSTREMSVLELMVNGHSPEEVADRLSISPHTVRTHVQNVMSKLGAGSRVEMINIGRRSGLRTARASASS